jgi:hypothetical protein
LLGRGALKIGDGFLAAASRSRPFSKVPIVYITGAAVGRWPSRGVPNSVLIEKSFAPAQLITAVFQLLNTGTPTSWAAN